MPDDVKTRDGQDGQIFAVSHLDAESFQAGLRDYHAYRDLGIAAATNGKAVAHVAKVTGPCPEGGSGWHYHDTEFQFVYVLKGSITVEFEGQGAIEMKAGSSWIQPPRIKHQVLAFSDDMEALELVLPANFGTTECAAPSAAG